MIADPIFFRDLAYVFAAAVVGGGLALLSRQPLILGYVLGGILISPLTPGPAVSDIRTFELFAEIGVILLMFSIGIEFSLRELLRVKWVATVGGPLGILLSIGLAMAAGRLLGWSPLQGAVVGMAVSVASTMVLARLLIERGELHARHGRIMLGITLVEDLAVVVLTVLIPRLGALDAERVLELGRGLGIAAAILLPFFYLAARVVPAVVLRVARTGSQELFLLVALAIALSAAALTQAVGLSLALGAFLAGLLVSQSDYAHETLARLLPLRDAFVALFFVTMGALVNPAFLGRAPAILALLVGLVVVGKFLIWTTVVRIFGHPWTTAALVAVGLTQIGEFSFILVQVARRAGHVSDDVYQATLAASLLTILTNAALVRHAPRWLGAAWLRTRPGAPAPATPPAPVKDHVVICGFGRVGGAVGAALEAFGVPFVAVERDPAIVAGLTSRAARALFGDAANRRLLEAAGVEHAALVVVALPEIDAAHRAVRAVRSLHPTVPILARAHHAAARARLLEAGATEVIQPELEAAATIIRHALRRLALPRDAVLAYLERFRAAMAAGAAVGPPGGGPWPEVREVEVGAGALADRSLREARLRERLGVTVLAVARADGGLVADPSGDTVLRPGDRVRVFGLPESLAAFTAEARGARD